MKVKTPLKLAGPGTIAMIVCLILLVSWNLLRPSKVRIERKVEASGESRLVRKPSPALLLMWKDQLGLSPKQVIELQHCESERQRELVPFNAAVKEAIGSLQSTQEQPSNNKVDIGQITAIAAQIKAPSRQLRAVEVSFSERAWSVLNQKQRQQAQDIRLALSKSVQVQKEAVKP
ncbi:hypothetical protein KBF38_25660 [bacterium]|nr:hypothetical protein [bacterium]